MQVRALVLASMEVRKAGFDPKPELMIPLVATQRELLYLRETLEAEVKKKVQPLWADPMYGKDLAQSYFSQTQKNNLSSKMSIGQALLVFKGAVLIGNQRILSFMKEAGVDVHA